MDQILVLNPLPVEHEAFLARLRELKYELSTAQVGSLRVTEVTKLGWKIAIGGHGKTQFGIQTQYLLSQLTNIKTVVCAGAAGGISPEVSVFDVVVAEKTIEHDYRLRFIKRPNPVFYGDETLLTKVKTFDPPNFKIYVGAIASGDEDIVDSSRARELQKQTGALTVAWEGAGGARACKFNNIPFLEVRGITDDADGAATVDFSTHVKFAMKNVCDVLLAALS
ncbi:5'-methylthioadenosine/S-adenosylhomocysteine nucleosidase [bacterium]|nr:5'-methylthioadenosine/S-adenosylhomocysteine nucleosidase [bacterium]